MSILKALGIRNMVLSAGEAAAFFIILTPLYFLVVGLAYAIPAHIVGIVDVNTVLTPLGLGTLGRLAAMLPVWMWVVEAAGYLLLITIYWAPGEVPQNRAELGGLILFFAMVIIAGLAWLQYSHAGVTQVVGTFWRIVSGQMVSAG